MLEQHKYVWKVLTWELQHHNVMFPLTPRSPPPLISVPLTPPPTAAQQPSPLNVNPFYLMGNPVRGKKKNFFFILHFSVVLYL